MSGHRQAAVALHGLASEDREAILAELADSEKATLRAYLDELSALGFDAELPAETVLPQRSRSVQERINAASAAQLIDVFGQEPASLVGQFLALHHWAWRDEFLSLLSPQRREQVRAAQSDDVPASARARYLLDAVSASLDQSPVPPPKALFAMVNQLHRRVRAWMQ